MLQTFLPLFFMTFGICLFIVLMQFLWKYVDDMVGKGLEISVLAELFMYAALSLMPLALPLAILLGSLMTFGNLGERLELLAMKSAGVSLLHIMRPLIVTVCLISIGAFLFQNYVIPVAQVKFYTLLWSIRQKSPELDIPEGVFYGEITGYNVYVRHKDNETGLLRDMMIYDYSNGFENASVMVADSGRLKASADKKFLVLSLYNGESFRNLDDQSKNRSKTKKSVPYQRETFESRDILIEFDANLSMSDESFMQNQFFGKNLRDLQTSIDSIGTRLDSIQDINSKNIYETSYKQTLNRRQTPPAGKSKEAEETQPATGPVDFDNLYQAEEPGRQAAILARAKSSIENLKADYFFKAATVGDEATKVRRHLVEWHNKFTMSFACLVFFFIGAPLGAIIRKGGLGTPVVLSVILFIFYYIINNVGSKMARSGVWPAWEGMWLSSVILTLLGIFLTYKAVNDSVVLNADTYLNALKNLFGKREGRKVERKDVILFNPDYVATVSRLQELAEACRVYLVGHKRWMNYFRFWKQGGHDPAVEQIAAEMESIVEELSNSDQNLVLNKLMDFPIIAGYDQVMSKQSGKRGMLFAILFPIGLPFYLLATYQRKLLRHDIEMVQKTSGELMEIVKNYN